MNRIVSISVLIILGMFDTYCQDKLHVNKTSDSVISIIVSQSNLEERILKFKNLTHLLTKNDGDSLFRLLQATTDGSEFYYERYTLNLAYEDLIRHSDPVLSLKLLNESIDIASKIDSGRLLFKAKSLIPTVYQYITFEYSKALEYLLETEALYKKMNLHDPWIENMIIESFGSIYLDLGDFEKANIYLSKGLTNSKQIGDLERVAVNYINLGELQNKVSQPKTAIIYLDSAIWVLEKMDEQAATYYLSFCHGYKGRIYLREKYFDAALSEFESAYQLSSKPQNRNYSEIWITAMGEVSFSQGNFSKALTYFKKADSLADKNNFESNAKIYANLARTYDTLGFKKEASLIKSRLLTVKDSLAERLHKAHLEEIKVRHEVKLYSDNIVYLNERTKLNRIITLILTLLATSATILALYLFRKQKQLDKLKVRERELEIETAEANLNIKILSEEKLKSELILKDHELVSQAVRIAQKTELLERIQKEINGIQKNNANNSLKYLNTLSNKFNTSQRIEKDWENFKLYFEQVHKGFFDNLCASFPDLSQKDIKLCALLKLNMDTKQIATILEISPESVKMARYRIRKKLGLKVEQNISSFLRNFEQETTKIP